MALRLEKVCSCVNASHILHLQQSGNFESGKFQEETRQVLPKGEQPFARLPRGRADIRPGAPVEQRKSHARGVA
jgi:hypothetical protein